MLIWQLYRLIKIIKSKPLDQDFIIFHLTIFLSNPKVVLIYSYYNFFFQIWGSIYFQNLNLEHNSLPKFLHDNPMI